MATGVRVVSTRFSEDEYRALRSLSTIEDESINHIIRAAVHDYIQAVVHGPNYSEKVAAAKQRAQQADDTLKQRLGVTRSIAVDVS